MTNEMTKQAKGDFLTNPQALTGSIIRKYLDPQGKASEEELAYFIATCKERNLNPFTKEVYFIKYGTNPAQIVVSKDAFMKRAEQNQNFDGFEAGVVIINDGELKHITGTILPPNATLVGGWAKVYRKDRKFPIEADADFKAYNTGKSMWAKMPALMIRKVALVSAMREAFSENVGGLYTTDEMGQNDPIDVTPAESQEEVKARKMKEIESYNQQQADPVIDEQQPDLFQASEPISDEDLPFMV
ncbi:phage recombination protein Bet [Streptococcus uberis]|uniref:phage recombination protein Bet n=1 Tax=Streptococcus uberis TaxID=1349 RepID=UPI00193A635D|nr:phage recombination protein Bet [Streptococcus uberis]